MKIIISDNAHEEYREALKKEKRIHMESYHEWSHWRNVIKDTLEEFGIPLGLVILISLAAIVFTHVLSKALNNLSAGKGEFSFPHTFYIAIIVIVVAVAIMAIYTIGGRIQYKRLAAEYKAELDMLSSASHEDFIKYMAEKKSHVCTQIEHLTYAKKHPEKVLKVTVVPDKEYVAIAFDMEGKVETTKFYYSTEETRTDITEDVLEWLANGEIHFKKAYRQNPV